MTSKIKTRIPMLATHVALASTFLLAFLAAAPLMRAQAPTSFLGTVTAINGTTLSVKTDAGAVRQVDVPSSASLLRIAPGQKDLNTAATIQFSDLATGDRVLVKIAPQEGEGNGQALRVIAIKEADVAQKQQHDREDWQKRGVGGLVKSVDPASGVIVVTSGSGPTAKTITVNTTAATVLKRYAPASINYDAATPAPIGAIHAGDQLRARGTKSADGNQLAAEEVISGTFRNISGAISSVDAANSTFDLKDLATKKQVTIHVTPDAQMRRLPDMMARMLAARLSGGGASAYGGGARAAGGATASAGGAAAPSQRAAGGQGGGQWASQGSGGGDPNQMLSRLPPIKISDLKKGDAVMLVSTDGTTDVTAITLLAGVEPLLEAPAASQSLLNNWSMGSSAPDAGIAQ